MAVVRVLGVLWEGIWTPPFQVPGSLALAALAQTLPAWGMSKVRVGVARVTQDYAQAQWMVVSAAAGLAADPGLVTLFLQVPNSKMEMSTDFCLTELL